MEQYCIENIERSDGVIFRLGSIGECFSYVITNGNNRIVGYRVGSLEEVTTHVTNYVQQLNTKFSTYHKGYFQSVRYYKPCIATGVMTQI